MKKRQGIQTFRTACTLLFAELWSRAPGRGAANAAAARCRRCPLSLGSTECTGSSCCPPSYPSHPLPYTNSQALAAPGMKRWFIALMHLSRHRLSFAVSPVGARSPDRHALLASPAGPGRRPVAAGPGAGQEEVVVRAAQRSRRSVRAARRPAHQATPRGKPLRCLLQLLKLHLRDVGQASDCMLGAGLAAAGWQMVFRLPPRSQQPHTHALPPQAAWEGRVAGISSPTVPQRCQGPLPPPPLHQNPRSPPTPWARPWPLGKAWPPPPLPASSR